MFLFEIFIHFFPEYALFDVPYGETALAHKNSTAESGGSYDILILGDCYAWSGIRPSALQRSLGVSSFNFSVANDQTLLMEYVLLKRYLEHSLKKPRLVIFQISASSLMKQTNMNFNIVRSWILPYFRMDGDVLEGLPQVTQNRYQTYRFWSLLPSIRRQFLLTKPFWMGRIWNRSRAEYESKVQKDIVLENGFYNMDAVPPEQNKVISRLQDAQPDLMKGELSQHNIKYMKKILSLLAGYDIKTVVVILPIRNDALNFWDSYNLRKRTLEETRLVLGEHKKAILWDMMDLFSDSAYFADELHLNEKGAEKLSSELSAEIKRLNLF